MSYNLKYNLSFASLLDEVINVQLLAPDYVGAVTQLKALADQPCSIEKSTSGNGLWGFFGSICRVRLVNDGELEPVDFVVNQYTDLRCDVYKDSVLIYRGWIVVDDITRDYRAEPYIVELTFTDNVALLSDKEAPFTIDEGFTTVRAILQRLLAETGCEFDLRVFFGPVLDGNDDEQRQFEQTKLLPRSWMRDLSDFTNCREMLDDILQGFRLRLFQLNATWVVIRLGDYIYTPSGIYTGARYAFGSGTYSSDTITCNVVTDITPLQFSNTAIHKRPLVKVQDTFNLRQLPGIWNADLKQLGSLISSATVSGIRTDKYNFPFWTKVGAGMATACIVVETETATETELERYLLIPFVNEANNGGTSGILFNEILVSQGDKFDFNLSVRADSDSNFAARFAYGVLLEGRSGTKYKIESVWKGTFYANEWVVSTQTPTTLTTNTKNAGWRGSEDLSEPKTIRLDLESSSYTQTFLSQIPEDGSLYIKLGGFKNNVSNLADKDSYITDLDFDYKFFVNKSIQIEAQRHTSDINLTNLNEETKEIKIDDCVKYSASGTIYNKDNNVGKRWHPVSGNTSEEALGQLNTEQQMLMEGDARTIITGLFRASIDLHQFADIVGRAVPTRLSFDLQRAFIEGEFLQLAEGSGISYNFDYIYKANNG
jgi:hypothetical protein